MSLDKLDWALCRSFLAILREGSLSGAARALGFAHPTVRRHLDELEAALGSPLFGRSPNGLVPSELALELRAPAETMEAAAEMLVRAASADSGTAAGTVRITASEIIGAEVLPPMLRGLLTTHAGLGFEVVLTNDVEDLLRLDADIAVRMTRPIQAELVASRIGTVPVGLFAHEEWLRSHVAPKNLAELVESGRLIGQDRKTGIIRVLEASGIHAAPRNFCFRSDSDLAQLAAVRGALGVGVCQLAIAQRQPELKRVVCDFQHNLELWIVTNPRLRKTSRVHLTARL